MTSPQIQHNNTGSVKVAHLFLHVVLLQRTKGQSFCGFVSADTTMENDRGRGHVHAKTAS